MADQQRICRNNRIGWRERRFAITRPHWLRPGSTVGGVSVDLNGAFEDRLQEIDAYLTLMDALERQIQVGPPRIGGELITAQQQKILYSSVYLQLYNLVEATATWCVEAVASAAADGGRWRPNDLTIELSASGFEAMLGRTSN